MRQIRRETVKHYTLLYIIFFSFALFFLFSFFKDINKFDFDYKNSKKILANIDNLEKQENNKLKINASSSIIFEDKIKQDKNLKKIKAKSYLIYDIANKKVLFGFDEDKLYPLASVSKLMTAYVAEKSCGDKLKEKLDTLLVASDNEAADYIANNCPNYDDFIDMMNGEVKKNGLNMSFVNPSGLDINEETEASNFGDAVSVAKLLGLLYDLDKNRLSHTTFDLYKNITNTNTYADNLPFLIGSKTGYTDVAGGNLATLYEILPGTKIAIVVFGSSKEDRFDDTFILLKSYLENII